ncbi:MAG: hypothetical protein ACLVB1_05470 [Blautia obeum]
MKTYEELLSDIEDDMELMGALHIVYAMEENGVLTGYDISGRPYTISVTLKTFRKKFISKCSMTKHLHILMILIKAPQNWQ